MVIRSTLHRIKNKLKDVYVRTVIKLGGKKMVCQVEGDGKHTNTICVPVKETKRKR